MTKLEEAIIFLLERRNADHIDSGWFTYGVCLERDVKAEIVAREKAGQ